MAYNYYYEPMDYTSSVHTQRQKLRSLEATKEKIYKIHSNLINILEELESRIQKRHGKSQLPKSDTDYYDHREKDDETVDEVVQGQLLAFDTVLKGCDSRVKDSVRQELESKTKQWIAVREQHHLPKDIVDKYAGMILEIIIMGNTNHSKEFINARSVDYPMTKDDAQMIINASHKAAEVDKEYEKDPHRKAKVHGIRAPKDESQFIFISGYKDMLLALTGDGTILTHRGKWTVQDGNNELKLSQLYEIPGNHEVLGVTQLGDIYYSDRCLNNWKPISISGKAALKLVIGGKIVLGLDDANELWRFETTHNGQNWQQFADFEPPNGMIDIGFGKEKVICLDKDGRLLYLGETDKWIPDEVQPTNIKFQKIYPNLFNDQIWAVATDGNVYYRESNLKPQWNKERKGPKVESLALIDSGVFGIDKEHDLWFRRVPNYQGNQGNWERMESVADIQSSILVDSINSVAF